MIKTPLEKEEQKTLVEYLYTLKRQGKILDFFAPMNEVKRPRMKGKNSKKDDLAYIKMEAVAKQMGKRTGVSDICVITKTKVLFIELKRKPKKLKSGRLSYSGIAISEHQQSFIDSVNRNENVRAFVSYGASEAIARIKREFKELL